jgi:NAD(P)-dependent dehydrogenase (short-subunit alcohol dehydrogenase family)
MNVVITGTSRGIGLELAQLALGAGHKVLAVARNPEKSSGLLKLKSDFKDKIEIVTADMASEDAVEIIAAAAKDWGHVDILVNNAGILLKGQSRAELLNSFTVNSIAPLELTQALLPLLKKSKQPRAAHITSLMGSIADNGSGGYYAYRASKAALNMISMSITKDNPWLTSVVLHPGWVQTDMGGAQAPTSTRESAEGLWKVIDGLDHKCSGHFYDFKGKELPW